MTHNTIKKYWLIKQSITLAERPDSITLDVNEMLAGLNFVCILFDKMLMACIYGIVPEQRCTQIYYVYCNI